MTHRKSCNISKRGGDRSQLEQQQRQLLQQEQRQDGQRKEELHGQMKRAEEEEEEQLQQQQQQQQQQQREKQYENIKRDDAAAPSGKATKKSETASDSTNQEPLLWKLFEKARNISRPRSESNNQPTGTPGDLYESETVVGVRQNCPHEFDMFDPDDKWFENTIAQRSPFNGKKSQNPLDDDDDDSIDDTVLILTPISNTRNRIRRYFQLICSLSYPHRKISVVLGEDSSIDNTFESTKYFVELLQPYFRRLELIKLKGRLAVTSGNARHDLTWQFTRRRHMAMSRNQLLFRSLRNEKWVLWLDSDVKHIPRDLIQHLMSARKSIVAANCLYRKGGDATDTFDRNTWRETYESMRVLNTSREDFLMLEGYGNTLRKFLNDLKEEGDVVRLDGAGGCALLVEADAHRNGLVFPPFIYKHHIETEGMSKMAAEFGLKIYGLPSVNVIHP